MNKKAVHTEAAAYFVSAPSGSGAPMVDGTPGIPFDADISGPIPAARLRAISASAAWARLARARTLPSVLAEPAREQSLGGARERRG